MPLQYRSTIGKVNKDRWLLSTLVYPGGDQLAPYPLSFQMNYKFRPIYRDVFHRLGLLLFYTTFPLQFPGYKDAMRFINSNPIRTGRKENMSATFN